MTRTFSHRVASNRRRVQAQIRGRRRSSGPRAPSVSFKKRLTATRTKYAKKRTLNQGSFPTGGGSISAFNYKKNKLDKALSLLVRNQDLRSSFYITNTSARLNIVQGTQDVATFGYTYGVADMLAASQIMTTSLALGGTRAISTIHESCKASALLTNQGNTTVKVLLYDCIARKDLAAQTLLSTAAYDPINAWYNGFSQQGGQSAGYIGATPFASPLFTQNWKVKKVTNLILGPGSVHQHKINYQPMRKVSNEVLMMNNQKTLGYMTCATFMVVHAFPDNDSTNKLIVTTGTAAIDWVFSKQYKFTHLNETSTYINQVDNLSHALVGIEEVIAEGTGLAAQAIFA